MVNSTRLGCDDTQCHRWIQTRGKFCSFSVLNVVKILERHIKWLDSLEKYRRTPEEIESLEKDHQEGIDLKTLLEFHGYKEEIPIREISKLEFIAIYDHQPLTLDGKFSIILFILIIIFIGVIACAGAAKGNSLEDLKKRNPLLVFELSPGKYCLIDGNHRMAIQFEDVS